jgi:hypothetical protein
LDSDSEVHNATFLKKLIIFDIYHYLVPLRRIKSKIFEDVSKKTPVSGCGLVFWIQIRIRIQLFK